MPQHLCSTYNPLSLPLEKTPQAPFSVTATFATATEFVVSVRCFVSCGFFAPLYPQPHTTNHPHPKHPSPPTNQRNPPQDVVPLTAAMILGCRHISTAMLFVVYRLFLTTEVHSGCVVGAPPCLSLALCLLRGWLAG